MTESSARSPSGGRCVQAAQHAATTLGITVGYLSAVFMIVMAASIILGIVMRTTHIDNSWTYDVDLFALSWLAFVGASFTALREEHVTSGIALENMYPRSARIMHILRFIIIAGFLVVFTISGYTQFSDSLLAHETTLDVMSWPVWIPHLALPVGTLLWLIFEVLLFVRRLTTPRS